MGELRVDFVGMDKGLLDEYGKVMERERKYRAEVKETDRLAKEAARTDLDKIKEMDRGFRGIEHLGRGLLGIFGVSGGLAGAFALLRVNAEQVAKSLSTTGDVQMKRGAEMGQIAAIGGASGVAAVQRLARKLGIPEEKVRGKYAQLAGETSFKGAGLESQVESALVQELGGVGYEKRRAEAVKAYPQVGFAIAAERARSVGEDYTTRPATPEAAMQMARGLSVKMEEESQNMAAKKLGYASWKDVPAFQRQRVMQAQLDTDAELKRILGRTNPTAADEAKVGMYERQGNEEFFGPVETQQLARELLEAAAANKNSADANAQANRTNRL